MTTTRTMTMTITREDIDAGRVDVSEIATGRRRAPIHPGEILADEYMQPLGLSSNALARALGVPPNRISQIVGGGRDITAETALRLARYFGTSAELWLTLQQEYDLEVARRAHAKTIAKAVKPRAA
jgi:addiction module HigA family antidote